MNDPAALVAMAHPGSIDPGPRPELLWIPIDKLTVDRRYQRTLESRRSQKLIESIAVNFRWSAFQAILAAPSATNEGTFLIIDGQHRVEGARRVGLDEVPAVVVTAASLAEQANAFVRANTDRVAVNNFALYHARRTSGDPSALLVQKMCKVAGIEIPRYPIPADKLDPGQTLALATIERLPSKVGDVVAQLVLTTVAHPYRTQVGAVRAPVIAAVAKILANAESGARIAKATQVRAALAVRSADELRVKAAQKRFRYGGTEADAVAAQIEEDMRRAVVAPVASSGGIRGPTRAQLMGGR